MCDSADRPAALWVKQARAAKVQQQVGRLTGLELHARIHPGDKILVAGRHMEQRFGAQQFHRLNLRLKGGYHMVVGGIIWYMNGLRPEAVDDPLANIRLVGVKALLRWEPEPESTSVDRQASLFLDQIDLEQVHRWVADKTGHENVIRHVIEHPRRIDLLQEAVYGLPETNRAAIAEAAAEMETEETGTQPA